MKELIVNNYPKSSVAEAIKTIKTNLRFSSINKKIITVSNTYKINKQVNVNKPFAIMRSLLTKCFVSFYNEICTIICWGKYCNPFHILIN